MMKDKIIKTTEEICDKLIAENGGLFMGDLNQVMVLVRGTDSTAWDQDIINTFKLKLD